MHGEEMELSDPALQPLSKEASEANASSSSGAPRFTILKLLGRGSQGLVYLVRDSSRNDELFAVKYILRDVPSESQVKYMAREVLNHQQLSLFEHPHIVQLLEVFLTTKYVALILEYVDGLDLFSFLTACGGRAKEDDARAIFQQLILAVDFCHRTGKGHRDIKLGNILVQTKGQSKPLIKLCDFGFSKDQHDSSPKTPVGTAFFLAPEVITSNDTKPYEAAPADLWACGVVLFTVLFGGHPYLLKEHLESKYPYILRLVQNCKEGKIYFPSWADQLMPSAAGLVSRILAPDPKVRIKIPEIMQHPWFLENLEVGSVDRNRTMEMTKQPLQTHEEIQEIILQARKKIPQDVACDLLNEVLSQIK